MKKSKIILLLVFAVSLCILLAIGIYTVYNIIQNNTRSWAIDKIYANYEKTKNDFYTLEEYFTKLYSDNIDINAVNYTKITILRADLTFDRSMLNYLSAESKSQLLDYYTRIDNLLTKHYNTKANYDAYNRLFTDNNSDYVINLKKLTDLYNSDLKTLADVKHARDTFEDISVAIKQIKADFLNLNIPHEQEDYKNYVTDLFDATIEYMGSAHYLYSDYYTRGIVPKSFYASMHETVEEYTDTVIAISRRFNQWGKNYAKDISNEYGQIQILEDQIEIK